jgi:hypothetical protein
MRELNITPSSVGTRAFPSTSISPGIH